MRSDNGFSPSRRQAIIWTNAGISLIWSSGTNCNEISNIFIENMCLNEKVICEMAAILSQPQCVNWVQHHFIHHWSVGNKLEIWIKYNYTTIFIKKILAFIHNYYFIVFSLKLKILKSTTWKIPAVDFLLLSGEPDYFGRNKISSGGDLSHYSSASLY